MNSNPVSAESRIAPHASGIVAESTASKIRTFLYEIAEGTSNYRSLHSLTQQVEHQYHGRFLVELIQNAHDALSREVGADRGRIEIRLDPDDGAHGALYVGNDGSPFTESNFTSLSQLGQSDKNPQESIGNKGIGFRSVLEISDSPEIFSRRTPSSTRFDGLCFGFTPKVLSLLAGPMDALAHEGPPGKSPLGDMPLVDWDPSLLAKFRRAAARHERGWLARERAYLSPYLLPLPLDPATASATVLRLEEVGFATVLRLPLKSAEALTLVREKMRDLTKDTVLFLERVRSLVLDDAETRRHVIREARVNAESTLGQQEIRIASEGDTEERYRIWSRTIHVEQAPPEFQESIRQLPGKWPELREAPVSIAVRISDEPDVGVFSVFLPTLLATGSAAHVNAPFFADMSRTSIDFEHAYNRGLLDTAWQLALDVIRSDLAGKDESEARMIVDLLAPRAANNGPGKRWLDGITTGLVATSGGALADEPWFLSQSGWLPLKEASLFPPLSQPMVFTEVRLRRHATFGVFHACMNSRSLELQWLSQAAGFSVYPRYEDIAETAEVVAGAIHEAGGADWNAFWLEVRALLPERSDLLRKRNVLLGQDGVLHSAGQDCAVFFAPRRGVSDEDELASDAAIIEIPPTLQPHVAFLHDAITLYDESNRQTATRRFLDDGLVKRFRVEDIFAEVLIARMPALPVRLRSAEAARCADILRWGLRLLSNLVDRGIGEKTVHLLKNLAMPCAGGWYRADNAVYGPGWPESQGDTLDQYLTALGSEDCKEAAKRLLLPPDRPEWGGRATRYRHLLNAAGVFDGLRLNRIEPASWGSTFYASAGYFSLPEKAPAGVPVALWEPYRRHARTQAVVYYNGTFQYQLEDLYAIPGMAHYERLDLPARRALMDLILGGLCRWANGWRHVICWKMTGSASAVSIHSPLWFVLNQVQWLGSGAGERTQWSAPAERWHVSAKVLGGRSWQFDHLHPLPIGIAHRLDQDAGLASALADLGMPQYDLETQSGSLMLLNALAAAAESEDIRDPNVFLGQVRSAWGSFTPNAGQRFPEKLLVHQEKHLTALTPAAEQPVYIPDSSRSFVASLERFGLPVLAIEPTDASRLASAFVLAYGSVVVLTSTLQVLAVADGEVWDGSDTESLRDTEIDWVIEVALTLAAYWGYQSRGTGTARFSAQVQAFRETRVAWCASLSARLKAGDLLEQDMPSMWLADRKTLLISESCREDPALLSEALAAILERDDLVVPMMFALREICCEADPEAISRILETLRLRQTQYLEVREHWRGTLRHLTDLLMPFLTILFPQANHSALLVARSEEQLTEHLELLRDPRIDTDVLLAMTRRAADVYDFGLECFRRYGAALELDAWNAALTHLRERPLQNTNAAAEFAMHAQATMPVLRSMLASVLRGHPTAQSARELITEIENIPSPPHLAHSRWEVRFTDAMAVFAEFFERTSTPDVVILLRESESLDALIKAMPNLGIDPVFDPIEAARKNRERLRALVLQLQEIGLAWAVGISSEVASLWESRIERYMESLDEDLATAAYLDLWSDEEFFTLLQTLPRDVESQAFWSALDGCNSLEQLKLLLGVTPERLVSARRELADLREHARRQSRLISVCGREFDCSDDNLPSLWSHITVGLPDEIIGSFDPIPLAEPIGLALPPKRKPSGRATGSGYRFPSIPKVNENLVGLAGEIHAFRRLQHQYGSQIVSASAWLSSNAAHVYSDSAVVDDAAGCDFRFVVDGKTYHVEVKSSSGADEIFTLGSSEIRLAMDLLKSRRIRRRSVFLLLRVLHALSEQPAFQVLPNPYDERFRSFYDIIEAGARVRYRASVPEPRFEF